MYSGKHFTADAIPTTLLATSKQEHMRTAHSHCVTADSEFVINYYVLVRRAE